MGQLIKVARHLDAPPTQVDTMERARENWRFVQALDDVPLPPAVLIRGHSPLKLLHTVTSEGVHNKSDEQCLQLARHVRVLLTDLAERVDVAMKNEAELKDALSEIFNRHKDRSSGATS